MKRAPLRHRLAGCIVAACLFASASFAHAEGPKEDPDALFEEGNKLMDQGQDAAACPLFERSLALDPSLGTRLNLAICYEKTDRLGSATRLFREVERTAHDTGKTKRETEAKQHLEVLRAHASAIAITLVEEVVVQVDGSVVRVEDLPFVPLDPGEHLVEAIAARKKPFKTTVSITAARDQRVVVTVPALEVDVIVQQKSVVNTRRTAAYIAGGVGVAGVITAVVTGLLVESALSTADDHCKRPISGSDRLGCDAEGSDAVKRGESLLPINGIAIGVGVVGLGVGTYLFLTSTPRTSAAIAPAIGPGMFGLTGRF